MGLLFTRSLRLSVLFTLSLHLSTPLPFLTLINTAEAASLKQGKKRAEKKKRTVKKKASRKLTARSPRPSDIRTSSVPLPTITPPIETTRAEEPVTGVTTIPAFSAVRTKSSGLSVVVTAAEFPTDQNSSFSNEPQCSCPQEFGEDWIKICSSEDLEQIRTNRSGKFVLCQDITLKSLKNPINAQIVPDEFGTRNLSHIPLPLSFNRTSDDWLVGLWGSLFPSSATFDGTFEGNGKTIRGLSAPKFELHNQGEQTEVAPRMFALFYRIGSNGVVRNLRIDSPRIRVGSHSAVVAAENFGSILNVSVTGQGFLSQGVTGSLGWVFNAGGLVAKNFGEIANSSVGSEFIINGYDDLGGIAGICEQSPNSSFKPAIKSSVFSGKISSASGFPDQLYNFGGIVGASSGCVLDSAYFAGTISGETNTGGVIGAVTQSSIIVNSAANGVVIGGRAVGGLVGTISEAFNEPLEEGGILIRRSSFQGVLGGLTEIRNFPSAVGGIVGSVGNIERTIARHPPIPFLQTPQFSAVVIDRSYATGEFDLRQPVGVNSSSGIFIYPRNSYCGGFIGAVGTSQTASFIDVRQSYADMKPTRWAFDTPQTLRHLEEFPLLASNPNVVKLGLTGGTCQALGGMAGDAMLSRGSSVFNLENTPYLHFLADGVNGPLYRFSEPVFNQLQQYLVRVSPLRLDAYVSGVTQGQMMSIQTYLDRGWSIAPTEKRTGPIPTWRIQEGSYPYLSDEQWGIREEQEEAKRGQGENYSTNLLR